MKKLLIIAALLAAAPAGAQVVETPVDSPWNGCSGCTTTLAAAPLRLNSIGNLEPIPGQRVALGALAFLQPSVSVTFPGQKTVSMTIVGVRGFHEGSGRNMSMREHPIDWTLSAPLVVPAGQPATCRYDMPVGMDGKLICAVGKTVPVSVTPAPPPPTPTPTPTPSTSASKPGDTSPPLAQLIATDGASWKLVGGQVLRNDANTANPYSPGIKFLYVSATSTIRSQNNDGTYTCWTGTAWAGSGC